MRSGSNPSSRLDAYLDGLMSPEEARAFEAEAAASESLSKEIERARAVDSALRRLFEPPAGIGTPPSAHHRRIIPLAAAAALIAAAAVVLVLLTTPGPRIDTDKLTSAEFIYHTLVERGFTPAWKCDTDEEFARAVQDRLGQPLLLADVPAHVEVIGWAYSGMGGHVIIHPDEMLLLVRDDTEEVMAIVAPAQADRDVQLSGEYVPPLHIFRRQVGGLVIYELTPEDSPVVLQKFHAPDTPGGG